MLKPMHAWRNWVATMEPWMWSHGGGARWEKRRRILIKRSELTYGTTCQEYADLTSAITSCSWTTRTIPYVHHRCQHFARAPSSGHLAACLSAFAPRTGAPTRAIHFCVSPRHNSLPNSIGSLTMDTHGRRTEDLKVERFGCAFLLYDRFVGRHDHVTRTQVRVIRAAQGPRRNRGGTRQRTQSYHGITQCSAKYRVCGICSVVGWRKDGLDAGMGTCCITLRTQLG